jgi:hypothetical protein
MKGTHVTYRRFAGALGILGATGLLLALVAAPSSGADGSRGFLTFKDVANGTTWSIGLQEAGIDTGKFQFAAPGVGLAWPEGLATVVVKSDSSVIVRYEGPGFVDPVAALDPVFGYHQGSGEAQTRALRLEAQVNPDRITASAELWVDGVAYKLVDRRSVADADADLTTILGAFAAEDWSTVHRWLYSAARASISEAAFIARSETEFSAEGTIATATRSGPVTYGAGGAGFDTATAPVTLTLSSGQTILANASLIWETDRWNLLSITPEP